MAPLTYTSQDTDIMARTLFGEAVPHNEQDAVAIAWVIRNRLEYRKKRWGLTVAEVCQKPMQFSCWNGGDSNYNRMVKAEYKQGSWLARCRQIAYQVLDGAIPDPTFRSTHYHTPAVSPKWSKKKSPVYQTAGHLFFNDIDTPRPRIVEAVKAHPVATTVTVAAASTGAVIEQTQDLPITEIVTTVTPAISTLSYLPAVVGVAVVVFAAIGVGIWYFLGKSKRG